MWSHRRKKGNAGREISARPVKKLKKTKARGKEEIRGEAIKASRRSAFLAIKHIWN